jgi:CRISPR-associated endonuclease/helicase Cas3
MGITSSSSKLYSHPNKLLRTHLLNVADNSRETVMKLSVDLSRIGLTKQDLAELCWILGACHDYGKATPFFQRYLMETDEMARAKLKNRAETNHAHLSSLFAYHQLKTRFNDSESPLVQLIPLIGYEVVRRHHGNLGDMQKEVLGKGEAEKNRESYIFKKQVYETTLDDLLELYRDIFSCEEIEGFKENIEEIYTEIKKGRRVFRKTRKYGVEASVLTLFCFSVLISMDKEDASGLAIERTSERLHPELIEKYRRNLGYDKPDTELNKVRNNIYLNAEEKVSKIDLENRILSLNMPTGSGKTLTGFNFALRLRDRLKREKDMDPRIIYCVSFISIIDQNSRVFEDAYKSVFGVTPSADIMLKHHHLADVLYDSVEDENEYDILDSQFFIEGWNSEIIFTTFVQFFHSILTNRNRALRKLHRIANSVVLLDEVQSIPHEYWPLLKEYLTMFSEFFHTYFIFMTATMPYIFSEAEITEIIDEPEQYYGFFDRVDLYPRLEEKNIEEYMIEITEMIRLHPEKRYLLIHNTVKSSQRVYRFLRERLPENKLVYLSTMVTPKERLERIDSIREDVGPVVVVSTQLVEAGVDIDVDIVFRDMAPLDSVIQASGRCNRNFGKERGSVYLVKLVDVKPFFSYIYGVTSVLVTRTLSVLDQLCFPERGFRELVDRFYEKVRRGMTEDRSREVLGCLEKMEFEGLKWFKLIDDDYPKVDVYVEDDAEAESVWERYIALRDIRDWKERRMGFLLLKKAFLEHVISVPETYRNKVGWSDDTEMGHVTLNEGLYDVELGFVRDEQATSTTFI